MRNLALDPKDSRNTSSINTRRRLLFLFVFVAVLQCPATYAQGFRIENKEIPTVVGAKTFVALEGGFSIALPPGKQSYSPLSYNTAIGPAKGEKYVWETKEGTFTEAYIKMPSNIENAEEIFTAMRQGHQNFVTEHKGRLTNQKTFELDGHPAMEVRGEYEGGILIARAYTSSRNLIQNIVVITTAQQPNEALAIKALDSFKILSETEVAAAIADEEAKATPSPLPQEPVASRAGSDAGDEGLRGQVKTVFKESEDLSGTWTVQGRKRNAMDYYNEQGNLTKTVSYDYMANLSDITVYGYVNGARVSTFKDVEHPYNPPAIATTSSGQSKKKSDPGYIYKFGFEYDPQGRLTEHTFFFNTGERYLRYVYKYTGNKKEELVYDSDGSLNQHYVTVLDDKGNELEMWILDTRDGSVKNKTSYAYEFDSHGNWIKRTDSKLVKKDGKSSFVGSAIYYRTITYYK